MQTLLKLLQDGRFHSGEELGAVLGISRSAVWKRLQHLEAEHGLQFHKVRGRGYRLASPSVSWIRGRSTASGLSRSCPPSIQPIARPCAGSRLEPRRLSLSSPSSRLPGVDVAGEPGSVPMERTSIILWPLLSGGARELEGLSLVVGLAVLRALESLGVRDAGLKWPNDVLQGGKKIAGILLELSGDPADLCHVVIGIGINVNMKTATDIGQPWTSLREALGSWWIVRGCFLLSIGSWPIISIGIRAKALLQVARSGSPAISGRVPRSFSRLL